MEKNFFIFLEIFLKCACRKLIAILEQKCKSKCWSACFKDYVVLWTKKKVFWTVSSSTYWNSYLALCIRRNEEKFANFKECAPAIFMFVYLILFWTVVYVTLWQYILSVFNVLPPKYIYILYVGPTMSISKNVNRIRL